MSLSVEFYSINSSLKKKKPQDSLSLSEPQRIWTVDGHMTFGLFFYWKHSIENNRLAILIFLFWVLSIFLSIAEWFGLCNVHQTTIVFSVSLGGECDFQHEEWGAFASNTRNEVPLPPNHQWFGCMNHLCRVRP